MNKETDSGQLFFWRRALHHRLPDLWRCVGHHSLEVLVVRFSVTLHTSCTTFTSTFAAVHERHFGNCRFHGAKVQHLLQMVSALCAHMCCVRVRACACVRVRVRALPAWMRRPFICTCHPVNPCACVSAGRHGHMLREQHSHSRCTSAPRTANPPLRRSCPCCSSQMRPASPTRSAQQWCWVISRVQTPCTAFGCVRRPPSPQ